MKKQYSLYLDEDFIKQIEKYAKKAERSSSWIINDIIEKFLINKREVK